ncbi:MAG: HAD family hydrolase [Proteobacteria bacterium]|nr:MAG: HAD family hydrolase [Pseudomonadota bacterium]
MQTLRGLLLDLDGTFLDSNDAHALSWVDAFEEAAVKVELEKVRKLIGMGGDKLIYEAAGMKDDTPEGEAISARRAVIFAKTYLPELRPFAGGRELLQRARERGLKLVVATSATGGELEKLLRAAKIDDLIQEAATSSDAERSKPDPDIIEAAIRRSGLRAGELLMIGDTPYDVTAAKRAGVDTVAVQSGGWSEDDLGDALAVYRDVGALHRAYDDSPLARRA